MRDTLKTTIIAISTAFAACLCFSCCCRNNTPNEGQVISDKEVYDSIVNKKWGTLNNETPDSLKVPLYEYDYDTYFAFNSDSTVDFFDDYPFDETGIYSIDGQLITCLFTIYFDNDRTKQIFQKVDDDHNYKIVFLYKDGLLYYHDEQVRYKKWGWAKVVPYSFKANQYLSNAGTYINDKYNVYNRADLKPREPYDTTADALCVVERFDWRTETTFKNGKRNGLFKKYVNGRLYYIGFFKDGQPCGDWFQFDSEGDEYHWKEEKDCNCDDFYNDNDLDYE